MVPAAALLFALGCQNTEAPTTAYEVAGVVRDARSQALIEGAQVRFQSDTLYTGTTQTDDEGRFQLVVDSDVPRGQLSAEAAGYRRGEQSVYFDTRQRTLNLELLPE